MKLVVCILLFSIYAHTQIKSTYTLAQNTQVRNPDNPPSENESESLDDELSKVLNQQFNKIKSACEENKAPDQRIADVKEGIDNLSITTKKYLSQRSRLSISHLILLSELDDIFSSGMLFRGSFTKQTVQENNVAYNFINYYKFMHNLGDNVDVQDFEEQWVKDIAQGLSCLYPQ